MSNGIGRIAMAEKLSVQQLKQAIQDKTVPAYIGIPMLQEKEAMEARMRQSAMAMQQPQQQPPIAEEVMQQADSIDSLPTNLPPTAMAHGGIVAFADGGDVDNAYDEDYLQEVADAEDDARQASFLQKLALLGEMPKSTGMSYKEVAGSKLKADSSKPTATGHKYEDMALKFAEKYNVDPKLALHVLNKETGGLKNPETARSKAGAMGVMQLMPATARGLGVKDPLDAEQNIEGGIRYLSQLSRQFDNPRLVAAAYNAGPGNVRKYGGVPPFTETRGYVQGLAEGGVARYDDGGVTTIDPVTGEAYTPEYEGQLSSILGKLKRATGYGKMLPESERGWSPETPKTTSPADLSKYTNDPNYVEALTGSYPAAKPTTPTKTTTPVEDEGKGSNTTTTNTPEEPKKTAYDSYIEKLMAREGDREKRAEQDKWLSLMTAGLGIMGGTSQYAAANIGQGALAGVNQYAGLRKQAAAEEASDVKNMLLAQKYKEQGELARASQAATEQYRTGELKHKTAQEKIEQQKLNRQMFDDWEKNQMAGLLKRFPAGELDPKYQAAVEALKASPDYVRRYNALLGGGNQFAGFSLVK